jgi:hypothetical protein
MAEPKQCITSSRKIEQQQKQQFLLVKKVGVGWS